MCTRAPVYVCIVLWGKIKQRREVRNWEGVEILTRMVKYGPPVVTCNERPEEGEGSHVTVLGE